MTGEGSGNIASGLDRAAWERPDALAVLAPSGRDAAGRARHAHWTFRQLAEMSNLVAAGLQARGVEPGTRTVLMVRPGLSFFAFTFGLFKAGAVPVLVDPGLGLKNLGPCLAEAEPGAFVGIPAAQAARRLLGWGKASIRTAITVRPDWPAGWQNEPNARAVEVHDPDAIAAILFTSGSTGLPKGAVYTHRIFWSQIDLLRKTYAICPGEVDL